MATRLLLLVAVLLVPASAAGEVRTWTDITGQHTVEAEFFGLQGNIVRLRKRDQTVVSLPLGQLSEADQQLAVRLRDRGALVERLQSSDQSVRVSAATALLADGVPREAVPSILQFIRLEIAELSTSPLRKRYPAVTEVPMMGDETSLVRIKADPRSYLDKTFVIVGGISASSYYGFGYRDAESTHYAMNFVEVDKSAKKTGNSADLYVPRTFSALLVERMVQAEEQGFSGLLVRIRATLDSARYEGAMTWNLMEVIDWQMLDREANRWKPWALE